MWSLTMADAVLQSPTNPHFFKPLLPGFHSHMNIPVAFFSKHLQGRNGDKTAKLRSDASDRTWEVVIDGRRLTGGWKEFVTTHDLRAGDVLVFRHEGDLVFHVTALGPSCCEAEYTTLDDCDEHKDTVASRIKPMKKRAKNNPMKEDYSSSDHSCFVANVTVSSLHEDKLYVPVSFVRSNGLSNTYCNIDLLNEMGRSWKLNLVHNKKGSYLRHGWRTFCSANGINEGRYTFKLVLKSETPAIRLYHSEHRHENDTHSYLVGSITPSSLRNDALYLSRRFVNSNGLMKGRCCEMILKNANGGTWCLVLRRNETNETTVISGGWRSFCQTNGLKVRDPFRFKLVGTREQPVLQLCPAESTAREGM
ncbi:B3 domain-containing protein REM17-like isoform X2 [Raphanus sativus]|uniref:B3 domain-containing protein REM17-like isoform X2 n=1 Tax=Raphanus sativus TaxID=3726 RepID=A0A6J0KU72_RAPSA|nr:B3 domain-containing protein REM17-like isoform X2 [Raphanus sativus]